MTSLNPSLRLALLQKAKGKKNIFQKGFTLVELMTVIVIVGILSAVALPSFLSQGAKAKGTEATAQISSIMKDAAAIYQQEGASGIVAISSAAGVANNCTAFGAPTPYSTDNTVKTKFDYSCTFTEKSGTTPAKLAVTATANNVDTSIASNTVQMDLDLDEGTVSKVAVNTSRMFGGTKTDV